MGYKGLMQFLRPCSAYLLVPLFGLLLAGCQARGPETALQDYVQRLERTLQIDAPGIAHSAIPAPPRPGAIRLEQNRGSLDTLDFLSLSGCALQVTIGKRNSSLGRMAAPSQRLLLELEYLRLAPPCIQHMREQGRDELADTLQRAWDTKRAELPASLFNATLGSSEYRQFWRGSPVPGGHPSISGGMAAAALAAINAMARQWLSGDYRADNLEFEIYLGEVAAGAGDALSKAMAGQWAWLDAADRMLAARRQRGPLCGPTIRHQAADVLPRVVEKVFIGQVQPHSADLNRRYYQLLAPVRELEKLLADSLPAVFVAWKQQRDGQLQVFESAPRRHVEELQSIMEPCGGLLPAPG